MKRVLRLFVLVYTLIRGCSGHRKRAAVYHIFDIGVIMISSASVNLLEISICSSIMHGNLTTIHSKCKPLTLAFTLNANVFQQGMIDYATYLFQQAHIVILCLVYAVYCVSVSIPTYVELGQLSFKREK